MSSSQSSPQAIQEQFARAQELLAQGDLEGAIVQYREVLAADKTNLAAWHQLAQIAESQGKFDEAIGHYRKAIELDANPPFWVYRHFGFVLSQQEQLTEAVAAYQKAIALNPEDVSTYGLLGQVQGRKGDIEGAISCYQKQIELSSNLPVWVYLNLGDGLSQIDRLEEAIEAYTKALALEPENAGIRRLLTAVTARKEANEVDPVAMAKRLQGEGKLEEALAEYRAVLEKDGSNLVALHQVAQICEGLGQWDEAVEGYRRAVEVDADSPSWVYRHLGFGLSQLGDLDGAVEAYERALELNPEDGATQGLLGQVLENMENLDLMSQDSHLVSPIDVSQVNNKALTQVLECKINKKSEHQKNSISSKVDEKKYTVSIKICAPDLREGQQWGDFHYAEALKRAFIQQGYDARVDCQDAWDTNLALTDDIVIVLRGRHQYIPKNHQINFLWMISHPDRITDEELNLYDHVFVASQEYAQKLEKKLTTEVSCMYQCTDPDLFYPSKTSSDPSHEILFIGSSRNTFRPIIRDVLDLELDVAVYGPLWEKFIHTSYIKGLYVANDSLKHYYSNCKLLLNDHWDTMRQEGFLSNRLFDASSCGTFIITDEVLGLANVFGDAIETYNTPEELRRKISYYIVNEKERNCKAEKARDKVLESHTFSHRVKQFINVFEKLKNQIQKVNLTPSNSFFWKKTSEEVKAFQNIFLSNVLNLQNDICQIKSLKKSIFSQWIWLIDRNNDKFDEFLEKFKNSEVQLLTSLLIEEKDHEVEDDVAPLVSVIMPTFNRAYVIADGIQSVIEQTYKNWELLICDDGSTDNTKEVVEQFQDVRIRYFQLPKSNGSAARNFGLSYASGKYVAYLDSDNIWHPQHLYLCIKNLEIKFHALCCYTGYIDTETVTTRVEVKSLAYSNFNYPKLLNRNFIDLNSFVHRRFLIDWMGGFDEELPRLQDWSLVLRYTYLFEPLVIPHYTVLYRRNVAWNQVTKIFEGEDVRRIVQNKTFSLISERQLLLNIQYSRKLSIQVFYSYTTDDEWYKTVAMCKLLSELFIVKLTVTVLEKRYVKTFRNRVSNFDFEVEFILPIVNQDDAGLIDTILDGINSQNMEQFQFSNLDCDIFILLSRETNFVVSAILAKLFYNKTLIFESKVFTSLLSKLDKYIDFDDDNVEISSQLNMAISLLQRLTQHPPILISSNMVFPDEKFKLIALSSTHIETSLQAKNIEDNTDKINFGFDKKDFVIVFWESYDGQYKIEELEAFQEKFGSRRCKVLLLQRQSLLSEEFESDINLTALQIQNGKNVNVITVSDEISIVNILKASDILVIWDSRIKDRFDKLENEISLPLIYSSLSGCIPVIDKLPKYLGWEKLNYCKRIDFKDWESLIKISQDFHKSPSKSVRFKRNVKRLYELEFSPHIVRERLKYAVFQSIQTNFQFKNIM